jgi:hypothetical protein
MQIKITKQSHQVTILTQYGSSGKTAFKSRVNFNDPKVQAHMKTSQEMLATTPLNKIFGSPKLD